MSEQRCSSTRFVVWPSFGDMKFAFSLFVLMPLINKFRDTNQDKKFKIDTTLNRLQNKINDALDIEKQLDYG